MNSLECWNIGMSWVSVWSPAWMYHEDLTVAGSSHVYDPDVLFRNFNHINIELWLSMHLGVLSSVSGSSLFLSLSLFFTQRSSLFIHMSIINAIKTRTVIKRWNVSHVNITVSSLALIKVFIWSYIDVILLWSAENEVTRYKHYLNVCQHEHCTYEDLSPTYTI